MHKLKAARTTPKIAGSLVYGKDELKAHTGNSVYKHQGKYHVFVGIDEILVTEDMNLALAEAAKKTHTPVKPAESAQE